MTGNPSATCRLWRIATDAAVETLAGPVALPTVDSAGVARSGDGRAKSRMRHVDCVSDAASSVGPCSTELEAWMTMHRAVTPPKTPLGQALRYLHRQWRRLLLFVDNGNIELTNNRREERAAVARSLLRCP